MICTLSRASSTQYEPATGPRPCHPCHPCHAVLPSCWAVSRQRANPARLHSRAAVPGTAPLLSSVLSYRRRSVNSRLRVPSQCQLRFRTARCKDEGDPDMNTTILVVRCGGNMLGRSLSASAIMCCTPCCWYPCYPNPQFDGLPQRQVPNTGQDHVRNLSSRWRPSMFRALLPATTNRGTPKHRIIHDMDVSSYPSRLERT